MFEPPFVYLLASGALILGILIGIITRPSRKKCESIADVEEAAILEIREKFWHKDISHRTFAEMCEEIRSEAHDEKEKMERRTVRLQKKLKK